MIINFIFCISITILFSYFLIELLINLFNKQGLYVGIKKTDVHTTKTINIGGLALYFVFIVHIILNPITAKEVGLSIVGISLVTMIGVLDDLMNVDIRSRLFFQTIASIACGQALITNGFDLQLFKYDVLVNTLANYAAIILFIAFMINSINFIDGVDGLASGVSIVALLSLAISFIQSQANHLVLLCFVLVTALVTYLFYNFSKHKKILLGDTGSTFLGIVIAFLVLKSCMYDHAFSRGASADVKKFMILCFCIIIPIYDSIRVVLQRLFNNKSIFKGDNSHIHHIFLKLGYTHKETTGIIICLSTAIAITAMIIFKALSIANIVWLFVAIFIVYCILLTRISNAFKK